MTKFCIVVVCFLTIITLSKASSIKRVPKVDGCPNTDGIFGICVFRPNLNCVSQDQCATGYKCCPNGCGSECLAVSLSLVHPGTCPTTVSAGGSSCQSDVNCEANQKCCSGKCVTVRKYRVPVSHVI